MTFAILEQIPAVGQTVPILKVAAVIQNVPDGTSVEEVVQQLYVGAGRTVNSDALVKPETEWPPDVLRMITQKTDPDIEYISWDTLN